MSSSVMYPTKQPRALVSMVVDFHERQITISPLEDNTHLIPIIKFFERGGCGLADDDQCVVEISSKEKAIYLEKRMFTRSSVSLRTLEKKKETE